MHARRRGGRPAGLGVSRASALSGRALIYLDHHAASPLLPAAREAITRAYEEAWANPSSVHGAGRTARAVLERARASVAGAIGAAPADLVFTSGGTEACNLACHGLAPDAKRLVTTSIAHPAVLEPLVKRGLEVLRLPALNAAPPTPAALAAALRPGDAVFVSWVNHDVGAISELESYALICRDRGAPLFVDACQALGKVPVDVASLGASAVAVASSKIGGGGGAGALWIARDTEVASLIHGGAQERGRRAGTPSVAAMAGFGVAAEQLDVRLSAMPTVASRRDRLERALVSLGASPNLRQGAPRVATVTSVSVPRRRGATMVAALDLEGVQISSGPACSSGVDEPSAVVSAMHPDEPERARGVLRWSLGPETEGAQIDDAVSAFERVLARSRTR